MERKVAATRSHLDTVKAEANQKKSSYSTNWVCHRLCIPQKNDMWECRRQHTNHFLALFEPLWLHQSLYYCHIMNDCTLHQCVFFFLNLNLRFLSQQSKHLSHIHELFVSPQPFFPPKLPLPWIVVYVWVQPLSSCCCATAFLPDQFLTQMNTDKGEERRAGGWNIAAIMNRETSREGGLYKTTAAVMQWKYWWAPPKRCGIILS